MSGFNKRKVQALFSFFFPQLNLSHPGLAAGLPVSVCPPSKRPVVCLTLIRHEVPSSE